MTILSILHASPSQLVHLPRYQVQVHSCPSRQVPRARHVWLCSPFSAGPSTQPSTSQEGLGMVIADTVLGRLGEYSV